MQAAAAAESKAALEATLAAATTEVGEQKAVAAKALPDLGAGREQAAAAAEGKAALEATLIAATTEVEEQKAVAAKALTDLGAEQGLRERQLRQGAMQKERSLREMHTLQQARALHAAHVN